MDDLQKSDVSSALSEQQSIWELAHAGSFSFSINHATLFTMPINEIRSRYFEYFEARGHVVIPSSPIIPQNDPTTLFTGSGMQPLVPYLLGEPPPQGRSRKSLHDRLRRRREERRTARHRCGEQVERTLCARRDRSARRRHRLRSRRVRERDARRQDLLLRSQEELVEPRGRARKHAGRGAGRP